MKLYQVMTMDLHTIQADASTRDAACVMREFDVGILPVMEGETPIGVITDRDIVLRVLADGNDASRLAVCKAMTPELFWMYEDEDLDEAIEAMCERRISRLFVKSRNGNLSGIVSAADIAALSTPERTSDLMRALGNCYWQKHLETLAHSA